VTNSSNSSSTDPPKNRDELEDTVPDASGLPDSQVDTEAEASGGSLPASDELEAALREATESVESRHSARQADGEGEGERERGGSSSFSTSSSSASTSGDKLLLEALSEELQSLKREYEALTKESDELKDRHLRLQAEFENFRRRGLKERQEAHNFGHQNLVKDLLPTVDNLERAIAHAGSSDGGDLQGLLQGIELVQRELLAILGKHGVERIDAESKTFDPALHEAMGQVEDDSVPANTVLQVLETGYKLRNRMLRAARVMVSRKSEGAAGVAVVPEQQEDRQG
jgi:molecular chaperone GrpE